ncbi:MAG: hypothetical protein AAF401_10445 [Pseudomonadota bacterium]
MQSPLKKQLLKLAGTLTEATSWTPSMISNRVVGGGTFFQRMEEVPHAGFTDKTFIRFLEWFDENWPEDLPWPEDIERPSVAAEAVS